MKTRTTKPLRLGVLAALLAASATLSHAFDLKPDAVSLEAGAGTHGARIVGAGLVWDWDFERMRRKAELTAHTELLVNSWRADAIGGGENSYTQVVLLPSLRMRLARGASPWYFELGIGASYMDRLFVTPDKQFSTRWNFYDVMGVGHTLGGPDGKHEIGMRWIHVSNGGLKKPNPGQDFLQLRYVARF
jgi:lipid A 3-O-deacylase